LGAAKATSATLISDFIRPAVHAIPPGIVRQLGRCRVSTVEHLGRPSIASEWSFTEARIEISLAIAARDGHDIALELLVCLGQALWERLNHSQRSAYWLLLDSEISAGIPGEIDEEALKQKRLLLSSSNSATSRRRLERYGSASFAGTVAEYIHSLWHDVRVRTGSRFRAGGAASAPLGIVVALVPAGARPSAVPTLFAKAPEMTLRLFMMTVLRLGTIAQ
jgi:hypothetical protein